MSDDPKSLPDRDLDSIDDVEIIEVVGLDEHGEIPPQDEELLLEIEGKPRPAGAEDAALEDAADDLRERWLRLHAEFDNYKKRTEREKDEYYRRAVASLVERLLPVLDNFERAVAATPAGPSERAFHEGMILIQRQLVEELRREGLRPIECVGQPFDPRLHEAVATQSGSAHPPNTVIEELQRGYLFQGRLLRPAAVRVSLNAQRDASAESDGGGEG